MPSSLTTVSQKPPTPAQRRLLDVTRGCRSRRQGSTCRTPSATTGWPAPSRPRWCRRTMTAIPGRRRLRATPSPTTATISATCSRPHRATPPNTPTSHHRSRAAAQAIPVSPRTVTVWVQTPLAATDQTGVANAKASVATQPAARDRRVHDRQPEQHHRQGGEEGRGHRLWAEREVVGLGRPHPDSQYAGTPTATTPGRPADDQVAVLGDLAPRPSGCGRCRSPRWRGPRARAHRWWRSATTSSPAPYTSSLVWSREVVAA